jgi:hypothetical protein
MSASYTEADVSGPKTDIRRAGIALILRWIRFADARQSISSLTLCPRLQPFRQE